jgi:hypothetical protein
MDFTRRLVSFGVICFGIGAGLFYWFHNAPSPSSSGGEILWTATMTLIVAFGTGFGAWNVFKAVSGNRPMATADAARRTAALAFTVPPGGAAIYIYRPSLIGGLAGLDVFVDGRPLGQIKSHCFMTVAVTPGHHSVGGKLPRQADGTEDGRGTTTTEFDVAEGKFAAVRLSWSVVKGAVLENMTDLEDAKRSMAQAKMVEPATV